MAFAVNLKTESSDNYLFVYDGEPTQEFIMKNLYERMGDELQYVSRMDFSATYDIDFEFNIEGFEFDEY